MGAEFASSTQPFPERSPFILDWSLVAFNPTTVSRWLLQFHGGQARRLNDRSDVVELLTPCHRSSLLVLNSSRFQLSVVPCLVGPSGLFDLPGGVGIDASGADLADEGPDL